MKPTNQHTGQDTMKTMPESPLARFFSKAWSPGGRFFFVTSLAAPHRLLRLLRIDGGALAFIDASGAGSAACRPMAGSSEASAPKLTI